MLTKRVGSAEEQPYFSADSDVDEVGENPKQYTYVHRVLNKHDSRALTVSWEGAGLSSNRVRPGKCISTSSTVGAPAKETESAVTYGHKNQSTVNVKLYKEEQKAGAAAPKATETRLAATLEHDGREIDFRIVIKSELRDRGIEYSVRSNGEKVLLDVSALEAEWDAFGLEMGGKLTELYLYEANPKLVTPGWTYVVYPAQSLLTSFSNPQETKTSPKAIRTKLLLAQAQDAEQYISLGSGKFDKVPNVVEKNVPIAVYALLDSDLKRPSVGVPARVPASDRALAAFNVRVLIPATSK